MKINQKFWLNISIFNLLIVATLGTIMRYKIGFTFPYLDQKHLQHAHSHFAFIGWITHTLFVLMTGVMQNDQPLMNLQKYRVLIISNLVCAYGMLVSFAIGGYNAVSITFSTASVLTAYLFAYFCFKDLKAGGPKPYSHWFRAGLWFNIISSFGTFALALMMATHNFDQKLHLASLYYYLHFQYNGFFMFACMGLFVARIPELLPSFRVDRRIFTMFLLSCLPAYFLSALWLKLPVWLYVIVVIAAVLQVIAWAMFVRDAHKSFASRTRIFRTGYYVLMIVMLAMSVKFLLQLGSVIPAVSKLAFGFRPVIIAYLHLILLAILSVFLLAYIYLFRLINISMTMLAGLVVFVAGVYINELILGVQGIASFSYTVIPYANEMLFGASVLIFISVAVMLFSQREKIVEH